MIIENGFDSLYSSTNARELKHVIEILLSYDIEAKKDTRYINLFEIVTEKNGFYALVLLSKEKLRRLHF